MYLLKMIMGIKRIGNLIINENGFGLIFKLSAIGSNTVQVIGHSPSQCVSFRLWILQELSGKGGALAATGRQKCEALRNL